MLLQRSGFLSALAFPLRLRRRSFSLRRRRQRRADVGRHADAAAVRRRHQYPLYTRRLLFRVFRSSFFFFSFLASRLVNFPVKPPSSISQMLWLGCRRRGVSERRAAASADEMTAQLTAKLFLYELYVGK